MKNIYIFSGLGADKRVFGKMDFSGCNTFFLDWVQPVFNEGIEDYAKRMSARIKHEKPVLIGLSFGGIMAVEVAKHIEADKIILLASAKNKYEIPFYFRWAGKLKLHKILPAKLMKTPNFLSFWFFGTESGSDKAVLTEILNDTDEIFLKWAIDKIVTWQNMAAHKNLVHIHGTADKILPIRFADCNISVKNGGHFMTLNQAEKLTELVTTEINH